MTILRKLASSNLPESLYDPPIHPFTPPVSDRPGTSRQVASRTEAVCCPSNRADWMYVAHFSRWSCGSSRVLRNMKLSRLPKGWKRWMNPPVEQSCRLSPTGVWSGHDRDE